MKSYVFNLKNEKEDLMESLIIEINKYKSKKDEFLENLKGTMSEAGLSERGINFVSSLLKYEVEERLSHGENAITTLKADPWFKKFSDDKNEYKAIDFDNFDKKVSPWKEYAANFGE